MKNVIIFLLLVVLVGGGAYVYMYGVPKGFSGTEVATNDQTIMQPTSNTQEKQATTTPKLGANGTSIGKSVQGRDILAYTFGTGAKKLVFVGGIHGGYEWNTVLIAYQLVDYLKANPSAVPANEQITVVPVLNPDGLNKVVGSDGRFAASDVPASQDVQVSGRFNANNVDLNRNFDCDWQPSGMWQNTAVDGGSTVFSEPESSALRDFIGTYAPTAFVGYYSSAGGVYSSSCNGGVSAQTAALTNAYAKASGYPGHASFDSYAITGDMENWLAKEKIPAISVLLTNHQDTEWTKNLAGVKALMAYYAK